MLCHEHAVAVSGIDILRQIDANRSDLRRASGREVICVTSQHAILGLHKNPSSHDRT